MPSRRAALPIALGAIAAVVGAIIAVRYHQLGLTLSHYDARGHLVVARRIIDSLTPGWQQIGAVWLPLPHLLNALPVQVDAWYRSGASAVAISIAAFAVTVGAVSWMIFELTGSRAATIVGAAVLALNPNVLYLQATPMTEPLLFALTTMSVAMLMDWCRPSSPSRPSCPSRPSRPIGCMCAAACLTRYEAWPVTFAALLIAAFVRWRSGAAPAIAVREVGAIALFPAAAIVGFLIFSRVVIGQWFVASGFFTPENKAFGDPMMSASEIVYGLRGLSGALLVVVAAIGGAALVIRGLAKSRFAYALIPLSLIAAAAVPWVAFFEGHPFRIRYMAPLIAFEAIAVGHLVGIAGGALERRVRGGAWAVAAAGLALIAFELRPLDRNALMVAEAQWDRPNIAVRDQVTACIGGPKPGETIMASMGSLGHYMQDTSRAGFQLRDFLHEGNGDIWLAALANGPRAFADWVLVEEKAEGGDMLAIRARDDRHFLDGYARVCEGAGVALYKRAEGRGQRDEGKG